MKKNELKILLNFRTPKTTIYKHITNDYKWKTTLEAAEDVHSSSQEQ